MPDAARPVWSWRLADLRQSLGQGDPEPASRGGGEVSRLAITGAADVFEGQFEPQVATFLAVVHNHHRPSLLGPLRIVIGMIVTAVVDQLLHRTSEARPSWPTADERALIGWTLAGNVAQPDHSQTRRPALAWGSARGY